MVNPLFQQNDSFGNDHFLMSLWLIFMSIPVWDRLSQVVYSLSFYLNFILATCNIN